MSSFGMMPPPVIRMSSRPCLDEQVAHAREERHVRAGEDREADHVDVLLHGGGGDHLGRLVQAGVDDLHAGVAQRGGDDLGAAVVAVEAGLGDEHSDWTGHVCRKVEGVIAREAVAATDQPAARIGARRVNPCAPPAASRSTRARSGRSVRSRRRPARPRAPPPRMQLGQARRGVQPDAMLALARRRFGPRQRSTRSCRKPRERIEATAPAPTIVPSAVVHQSRARNRAMTPSRLPPCQISTPPGLSTRATLRDHARVVARHQRRSRS